MTRPPRDRPAPGQAESPFSDSLPALDGADPVGPGLPTHPFPNPQSTPPTFVIRSYQSPNPTTTPSDAVQSTAFSSVDTNLNLARGNWPVLGQDDSQTTTEPSLAGAASVGPRVPTHPPSNARRTPRAGLPRSIGRPIATTPPSTAAQSTAFSSVYSNLNPARGNRRPNATTPASDAVRSTALSSLNLNPDPVREIRPALGQDDSNTTTEPAVVGADSVGPSIPTHPPPNARWTPRAGLSRSIGRPIATTPPSTAAQSTASNPDANPNASSVPRNFSRSDPAPPPPIQPPQPHAQPPRINLTHLPQNLQDAIAQDFTFTGSRRAARTHTCRSPSQSGSCSGESTRTGTR
jgi:hypothetical protein